MKFITLVQFPEAFENSTKYVLLSQRLEIDHILHASFLTVKKFHAAHAVMSQFLNLWSWIGVPLLTQVQDLFQPWFVCVLHMRYSVDQ